ncbi:cellulase family glycosylhydrolase [Litorivita sp. NS0012-18]|uniref:cellulase family glycosylhydrolase n=1 Tax=Litorivita sp. NS0012-18 TaxID=3127655 RepID=UPI003104E2C0
MKRLFVHIGTHKTGTTSIQYALARADVALARQGVFYPPLYANPNNPGHHFMVLEPSAEAAAPHRALIQAIDASPADTVIVSTELLSVIDPAQIAALADRYETTVVCLLRRQDDYIESMYRELCKSSYCALEPEEFVDAVLRRDPLLIFSDFKGVDLRAPLPADYERLIASYADLVGAERVLAIPYDDPAFGIDAVDRFGKALGIKIPQPAGGPRNVSFSPEIVTVRRMLDATLPDEEKLALRGAFWKVNRAVAREQRGQNLLGTEARRRIMAHYAASNARLRARFIPHATTRWLADPHAAAASVHAVEATPPSAARSLELIQQIMAARTQSEASAPAPADETKAHHSPPPRPAPQAAKTAPASLRGAPEQGNIEQIGLNFETISKLLDDPDRMATYMDVIAECGLNAIRLPFYWRHLVQYSDRGDMVLNEGLVNHYHAFVALLPKHIQITAVIMNCHPEVARWTYLGEVDFSQKYAEYVTALAQTFGFIDDFELWNEPNASDFYVSVKAEDGTHRPWTGAEYVDMVLRPGVQSLKAVGFAGKICGVSFAENGLVGHDARTRPAFANTLHDYREEFAAEFSDNAGHDGFYFIPDFAKQVFAAIAARDPDRSDMAFDAIGLHPYPYFGEAPDGFAAHSWQLTQAFRGAAAQAGLGELPLWITEVGARSLDLAQNYDFDAMTQADFVSSFMGDAAHDSAIQKVFWYKYRDEDWDLKQEKSFGLVDHEGRKKPAYYSFRRRCLDYTAPDALRSLQDDFGAGAVLHCNSVDASFWSVEKTEPFAYAIPAHTNAGDGSALLISPGRALGSRFRIETKRHLAADRSNQLTARLRFRIKPIDQESQMMGLGFQILNLADPQNGLFLRVKIVGRSGALAFEFGTCEAAMKPVGEAHTDHPTGFCELRLTTAAGMVRLTCLDARDNVIFEADLCTAAEVFLGRRLRGAIDVSRLQGPIHFIELSHFSMLR